MYSPEFCTLPISQTAPEAFQVVKRLKAAGTTHVTVLHVQDERTMRHRSAAQIATFDREDVNGCKSYAILAVFGLPAVPLLGEAFRFATLRAAYGTEASLIVLGSQGKSAVQEVLAGSTFENVVRLSRQAVLVACPQEK